MSNDGGDNLNRAICNAAGDAERAELVDGTRVEDGRMQAIFLKDYVKDLSEIHPVSVARPTFQAWGETLKQKAGKPPQDSLVHIKVTHTAINHVDLLYAHGVHQNNKSGLFTPPFTIGLEFSGIVLDIQQHGKQKCQFKPGDKVWGGSVGTHAEELILPASSVRHFPSPAWSLHDMAALGAGTIPVTYGALTTIGGLKAGETILVHAAAGGLGVYAVQIARALGARVIGTVGSQQKLEVIEDLLRDPKTGKMPLGEGVINYSDDEWEKKVVGLCKQVGKDGVNLVYDTVGLVQKSIRCTTFNGRIVVAGFAGRTGTGAEKVQELEQIAVNRILLKQIKLLGYRFGETSRRLPGETVKMWIGLNDLLAKGPECIRPVVYKTYKGLSSVNEALQALRDRKVYGKAVIEVCPEEEALRAARLYSQKQLNSSQAAKL